MFVVLSDPAIYEFENEPLASIEWLTARFARLETRRSSDGSEQWLNWVIRLPTDELNGYVQATVTQSGRAAIAYVLSSRFWGQGLAFDAVQAMVSELAHHHHVEQFSAVLKRCNLRSARLLEHLGFAPATLAQAAALGAERDEIAYVLERAEDFLE